MVEPRERTTVVENRNPMGMILGVLAILLLVFLAWLFLFNDGFGAADDATDETNVEQQQGDSPDINIEVPEGTTDGDQSTGGDESTTGDQSGQGDTRGDPTG